MIISIRRKIYVIITVSIHTSISNSIMHSHIGLTISVKNCSNSSIRKLWELILVLRIVVRLWGWVSVGVSSLILVIVSTTGSMSIMYNNVSIKPIWIWLLIFVGTLVFIVVWLFLLMLVFIHILLWILCGPSLGQLRGYGLAAQKPKALGPAWLWDCGKSQCFS